MLYGLGCSKCHKTEPQKSSLLKIQTIKACNGNAKKRTLSKIQIKKVLKHIGQETENLGAQEICNYTKL